MSEDLSGLSTEQLQAIVQGGGAAAQTAGPPPPQSFSAPAGPASPLGAPSPGAEDLSGLSTAQLQAIVQGGQKAQLAENQTPPGTASQSGGASSPAPQGSGPLGGLGNLAAKYLQGPAGQVIGEPALHALTGAASFVPAGLASAYQLATAPAGQRAQRAAQAAQQAGQEFTYQPRGQTAQKISGAADEIMGLPVEAVEKLGELAGKYSTNDVVPAAVTTAGLAGLAALGQWAPKEIRPSVTEATNAGLRLTPQQMGTGAPSRIIAGAANRAQLEREISQANYPQIESLVKQEARIPADQPLNETTLEAAKAPYHAGYNAVRNQGTLSSGPVLGQTGSLVDDLVNVEGKYSNPSFNTKPDPEVQSLIDKHLVNSFDANDAVNQIMQLRSDARKNLNASQYDPGKEKLGLAQRDVATALENQIDRHLQAQAAQQQAALPGVQLPGNPGQLIGQFRAARQHLAKINDIQDSMDGEYFSPRRLARLQDNGAPLTGNLGVIANAAHNFDRSVQAPNVIREHPVSMLGGTLGAGLGAMGGLLSGHGPVEGGAAGTMMGSLLPLATRKALASRLAQKYMLSPAYLPKGSLPIATAGATLQPQPSSQGGGP